MRNSGRLLTILLLTAPACVDLPAERDYKYIECSRAEGIWGGVERNGKEMCSGVPTIEITEMNTLHVTISLSPVGENGNGSLILNFEMPAGGIPSEAPIDSFFLGRYDGVEGSVEVSSASMVIREDAEGALGSYRAVAELPGGPLVFDKGVYYSFPL